MIKACRCNTVTPDIYFHTCLLLYKESFIVQNIGNPEIHGSESAISRSKNLRYLFNPLLLNVVKWSDTF